MATNMNKQSSSEKERQVVESTGYNLDEIFDHDGETGEVTWKIPLSRNTKVGDTVGTVRRDGFSVVKVAGVPFLVHRLLWRLEYGYWPSRPLLFLSRDRQDHRLKNLMEW